MRLGIVRSLGPAWHSRAAGRIDRRIALDLHLSIREEGGPVADAAGALLGMSTAGPYGRALVIPASTIDRILPPLLQTGRIARGWLGAALYPVALSNAVSQQIGQDRGLMVLRVAEGGPAAVAGVIAGDILVAIGGTVWADRAKSRDHSDREHRPTARTEPPARRYPAHAQRDDRRPSIAMSVVGKPARERPALRLALVAADPIRHQSLIAIIRGGGHAVVDHHGEADVVLVDGDNIDQYGPPAVTLGGGGFRPGGGTTHRRHGGSN